MTYNVTGIAQVVVCLNAEAHAAGWRLKAACHAMPRTPSSIKHPAVKVCVRWAALAGMHACVLVCVLACGCRVHGSAHKFIAARHKPLQRVVAYKPGVITAQAGGCAHTCPALLRHAMPVLLWPGRGWTAVASHGAQQHVVLPMAGRRY